MPKYSIQSLKNLSECDPRLQKLFNKVIEGWDCTIIDGRRTVAEEKANVASGASQTMNSKHLPDANGWSRAVDALPYPADWDKLEKGLRAVLKAEGSMYVLESYAFAGFVRGIAFMMGIPIRQGIDWNGNEQFDDQTFHDVAHTELASS